MRHVYANARCRSYPAKSKSQNVSQLHFQGRGFRLTGTPVSITPVSRCTLLRYIHMAGEMEDLGKFGIFARIFDSAWHVLQKM